MFNYKQLALAVEMRTRYGKPVIDVFANGFRMTSVIARDEDKNPTIMFESSDEIEKLLDEGSIADLIIKKHRQVNGTEDQLTDNENECYRKYELNGFELTIADLDKDYMVADAEIRFDSVVEHYHIFLRIGYQVHEKMITDLIVSQLQYWS